MSIQNNSSLVAQLSAASYRGNLARVNGLVKEGVDPNVWDQWGRTPLSHASGKGYLEIVELLLKHGAWVNPHEDYDTYETPLCAAAENGHMEIVRLLISAGADPHLHVGVAQRTPSEYADANGHEDVARYLRDLMDKQSRQ